MSDRVHRIAVAIMDSWWHMEGGDGPCPEPPDSGALQLAYDIVRADVWPEKEEQQ